MTYGQERLRDSPLTKILHLINGNSIQYDPNSTKYASPECGELSERSKRERLCISSQESISTETPTDGA